MLTSRGCLHSATRRLHSRCWRLCSARDPAYLGLFEPQQPEIPLPAQQGGLDDDDLAKRKHLHIAFYYKIREWASTTPSEYISRPPSRHRSHRSKQVTTHRRRRVTEEEEKNHVVVDDDDEGEESDGFDDADDGELDVVDDEDKLKELDDEDEDAVDKEDFAGREFAEGFHDEDVDDERKAVNRDICDTTADKKARRKLLPCDPQNDGRGDGDEELYYYTEKGKLKYKPIHIIAPKDEIYQRLSQSGLISSRLKKPLPVLKLVKKTDAEIVGWFYYCSIELLQFFRICHNLKEVKAIVEYHVRWSGIRTLARKYKCNPREIVKKYGRDLECEDKKGKKVRLMTRQEIKDVSRGVNKRVEMIHRFRALNILDEMD